MSRRRVLLQDPFADGPVYLRDEKGQCLPGLINLLLGDQPFETLLQRL